MRPFGGHRYAQQAWLHGMLRRKRSTLEAAFERGTVRKLDPASVSYKPPVELPGEAKGRKKRRLALLKKRAQVVLGA